MIRSVIVIDGEHRFSPCHYHCCILPAIAAATLAAGGERGVRRGAGLVESERTQPWYMSNNETADAYFRVPQAPVWAPSPFGTCSIMIRSVSPWRKKGSHLIIDETLYLRWGCEFVLISSSMSLAGSRSAPPVINAWLFVFTLSRTKMHTRLGSRHS